MRAFYHRHRALLGYLGIVVVAVVAVELHTVKIEHDLSTRDTRSCTQRGILAANQVFVLDTLRSVMLVDLHEALREPNTISPAFLARLRGNLVEAQNRIENLNPVKEC